MMFFEVSACWVSLVSPSACSERDFLKKKNISGKKTSLSQSQLLESWSVVGLHKTENTRTDFNKSEGERVGEFLLHLFGFYRKRGEGNHVSTFS